MKKHFRSILSLTLAVILLLSCGVSALAATKDNVTQYGAAGGYLAIGDSISRGCGAEGFYIGRNGEYLPNGEGQYGEYDLRNVQGCVPYLVAQAVGCKAPMDMTDQDATYWPFTYPGMTTAVTLDLLGVDDGFTDEKLNYAYYSDMLEYFGWDGSFSGVRDGDTIEAVTAKKGAIGKCGNIIDLIKNADLITVQLGMCDVFYRTYRIVSNGGMLADGMSFDLSSPEAIKNLVTTAVSEMWNGYWYWKANYPTLIETILKLNSHADIVMVGSFNLVNELTITDDLLAPIGTAFSVITDSMNLQYEKWSKEYGIPYANIANTETQAAELDWSLLGDFMDNTFTGTHPTQNGYDYIARQIISVLPPVDETKNISVDIGRFAAVDYVLVNGIAVKNYTLADHLLTIPYSGPGATNLTIGVKNEDGTIAAQTYTLTYKPGEGYSAYRVNGTNDAVGTATKPARNIIKLVKDLFQKIIDFFKGLFNKG